jgi:hypothetical protein
MDKNDGQPSLRASIASELEAAGLPASQASQQATSELLKLRASGPGTYDVHVGNTVIKVEVK